MLSLRTLAFRGFLGENRFKSLQNLFSRICKTKKTNIIEEVIVHPVPKPVVPKTYLAVFRTHVTRAFNNPAFTNKSPFLKNANWSKENFTLYNIPTSALPSLKSIISRLFQLGFVGVVCTHQQLSRDGQGFVKTMDDLGSLLEMFKKGENANNGDTESDFDVVDEKSQVASEAIMSSGNYYGTDIQSLLEMNTNLQEQLVELEPLVKDLVAEKIEQEVKLAETQEREEFYRKKCEQLEKDNREMLIRQDLILNQVEKMMKEVAENHARMAEENMKYLDRISSDVATSSVIKTFKG